MALQKVFRIELNGSQGVVKNFDSIASAVKKMDEVLKTTKGDLSKLLAENGNANSIAQLKKQINDLEKAQNSLNAERDNAAKSLQREADLEKKLAAVKTEEAKAAKILEQTEATRIQSQIAQEKELDRQIALEDKQTSSLQKQKAAADALPGSYIAIKAALAELRPFIQAGDKGTTTAFQGQNINFSGAIEQYKQLSFAEQSFRRQFQADGTIVGEYTSGIVNAFKTLKIDDIITGQITGAKQQLGQLETKTNDLVVAYKAAQTSGSADLKTLETQIKSNVEQTIALKSAIGQTETQLRGMGGVGAQINESISSGFSSLKNSIGQFALTYFGFQQIFQGVTAGVDTAKELADQTSNLEVELGKAKGQAAGLVDQLAKLDTRTKLVVLENIANIAAKAGVSEQNLVGVTQAIDKIKIAFGNDFGDVEQGTESLVKIINIFQGTDAVTGDNLLKVGNAVRTLANESVASVPFLNDFTRRMAGLKGISDISLPSVLGLASGFEQFGQTAEVSGTALVRIIPKIAANTEKFAAVAGLTQKQFSDLLKNNPAEALIKVAEGFSKGKSSIEEFESSFKDSGLGNGRVTSVIGVLGKNADKFRETIESAGKAINDTTNLTTAFNAKNENLAGTLDKVSKKFSDAANSKAFQATLKTLGDLILIILNNLPGVLTIGGLLALSWIVQNANLILLNAQLLGYNILIARNYILMAALTVIQTGYNVVLFLGSGAFRIITAAARLFGVTLATSTGPLGIILTIVGLLGSALFGLSKAFGTSIDGLSKQNLQLKIARDLHAQATLAIADQISKLQGYASIVKDVSISEGVRLKALQDLIAINPEFSKALQGNKIDLQVLNQVLNDYNSNLLKKAELEGAQVAQQQEYSKLVQLNTLKDSLEIAKAQKKGFGDLTDEQQAAFSKIKTSVGRTAFTSDLFNTKISDADFQEAFKGLNDQISNQQKVLDATQTVLKDKYAGVNTVIEKGNADIATITAKPFEVDLEKLQAQIDEVHDKIYGNSSTKTPAFQGAKSDLDKLNIQLAALQKEYDKLIGKQEKVRTPKLSVDEKTEFKNIDAIRDQDLADEKLYYSQGLETESHYLIEANKINQDALDKKIAAIKASQKDETKLNAEERKMLAEFNLQKITDQQETDKKLFDIQNKQAEIDLANRLQHEKDLLNLVTNDPNASNTAKLNAQNDYYAKALLDQIVFNQKQEAAEKEYGLVSIENEQKRKEAIQKLIDELNKLRLAGPEAALKDISDTANDAINKIKANISQQISDILDKGLSPAATAKAVAALEKEMQLQVLAAQVAADKISLDKDKEFLNKKLISEKEYNAAVAKLKTDQAALDTLTTNKAISNLDRFKLAIKQFTDTFAESILGIKKYTDDASGEAQRVADATAQTEATVKEAISNAYQAYFQNQSAQIDRDNQSQSDFLQKQRERVLATADSQAEQDTINRQFDQKKKDLDKKSGEEKKKNALKQASIDFALAVVKTFAQFGFPLGLIPVAALTFAYILQRSAIQAQTFAKGGLIQKLAQGGRVQRMAHGGGVPARGGDIGGNPHSAGGTPFVFQNKHYEAEVDEMNIIRTRNAPRNKVFSITGTQRQIASATNEIGGGIRFAAGASVKRLATGGSLGTNLRAPTFTSGYYSSGVNNASDISQLQAMIADVALTVAGVAASVAESDQKDVVLNPNNVTKSQEKTKRNISIGRV